MCGCDQIEKAPMAPAIPAKGNRSTRSRQAAPDIRDADPDATPGKLVPSHLETAIRALAAIQADALKTSVWVGDAFAERSRAMHYGDEEAEPIHGRADPAEAEALIDEGIMIAPILVPFAPPDEIN